MRPVRIAATTSEELIACICARVGPAGPYHVWQPAMAPRPAEAVTAAAGLEDESAAGVAAGHAVSFSRFATSVRMS